MLLRGETTTYLLSFMLKEEVLVCLGYLFSWVDHINFFLDNVLSPVLSPPFDTEHGLNKRLWPGPC